MKLKKKFVKLKNSVLYYGECCRCMLRDAVSPAYPVDAVSADFFVSMGDACKAADHLRRRGLRICSSPLDWMMCYTLKTALKLYRTGFADYFLEIQEKPYEDAKNPTMRRVDDVRNGVISIHHFPRALSLEEGRAAYREKAARHFANTHRFMSEADRFVMLTCSGESLENIRAFVEGMAALYSAEIVHINVRSGAERKREVIRFSDRAALHEYTFPDAGFYERHGIEPQGWWTGDRYEWNRILKRCRRTGKFSPPERATKRKDSYN